MRGMFDGLVVGLVGTGIIIGVVGVGIVWLLIKLFVWIFSHLQWV